MCIAIIGKVIKVNQKSCIVEINGKKQELNPGIVKLKEGDYVSCAAGLVVEKLENKDALSIINSRKKVFEK
jgi:hydrogenase maturation factor